jgi:transposase
MHLPASVRVYLCTVPCDMRRSFDGLHALVTGAMQLDAFGGHLFVFSNRRRDQTRFHIPIRFRCSRVRFGSR